MRKITRTIMGSKLQTELLLGLNYTHVENTTLNEKFDIQADVLPPAGTMPKVRYFCIGNGGHRNETGADAFPYTTAIQHDVGDAALYRHTPFLIRTPDNDLDNTARANYGLRKEITVNGTPYIAYYLKRLDFTDAEVALLHNVVTDGVVTSTPYIPTTANLSPTPPELPATGVVTTDGDYLSSSAILKLAMSSIDVEEYVNAITILYDNPAYAVISEIGLVAGVDRIVTVPQGAGSLNYQEVIVAQITTHLTAYYAVQYTNDGFDFRLELGGTESLFGVDTP